MQLDQITANIRLRSSWEAVDLGFAMVQTWWKSIYPPLIIFNLLYLVPLIVFLPAEYHLYVLLLFWWIKPISHRLILHILSQKLFNNELTTTQALREIPSLLKNTNFGALTFRRFSFSRGFNLPIWQLEGLKGKSRAQRQGILLGAVHSEAIWLTVGLAAVEIIMTASVIALALLFIPETHFDRIVESIYSIENGVSPIMHYAFYAIFTMVTLLVEPFYIGANFALYINRRTQLEAWDVELGFRKMAARLAEVSKKVLSLIAVCTLSLLVAASLVPQNSYAEDEAESLRPISEVDYLSDTLLPVEQSKEVIDDIINTKELKGETQSFKWEFKDSDKEEKESESFDGLGRVVATIFEFGLWILLAIGLILLYTTRERWLPLLRSETEEEDEYQAPEVLFGMDVRKESLPDDILASARSLWEEKKVREALSLLYRAALIELIAEKVALESSHTEGDILKLSQKSIAENKHQYLTRLTAAWQLIAYAHREPNDEEMAWLFDHWQSDFVAEPEVEAAL